MKIPAKEPRRPNLRLQRAKRAVRDVLVGPLSLKQLVALCRELKTTHDAGIPLVRSLLIVADHTGAVRLRRLLRHIAEQIRCGASLSDAVEWRRGRFPAFFREMVASGEASGRLDVAFGYLAEYYEEHLKLRHAIFNAMAYPVAVWFAAGFIPLLQAYLARMANVPHEDIGQLLVGYMICLPILAAKVWLLVRLRIPQALWRLFGGYLPYLGPVARGLSLSRFFQCLAMLLESGLGVPRGIEHAAKVAGNIPLALSLAPAAGRVRQGQTLTEALSVSAYIGDEIRVMVSVGEQSGKVDAMLRKVSQYAHSAAMHRLRILILTLESILVFGLGLMLFL